MNSGPAPASVLAADPSAQNAAARSALYSLLARGLAIPDQDLFARLESGSLAQDFAAVISELPFSLSAPDLAGPMPAFIELQSDYISCFETGLKGPRCPLYEGASRGDRGRKAVMEELLRFYHHFGLKMSERVRELPDHLSAELEFMHYLAFLETRACEEHGHTSSPRLDLVRAQRDFLTRHLAPWAPELIRSARGSAPAPCMTLLEFMSKFIIADLIHLKETLA